MKQLIMHKYLILVLFTISCGLEKESEVYLTSPNTAVVTAKEQTQGKCSVDEVDDGPAVTCEDGRSNHDLIEFIIAGMTLYGAILTVVVVVIALSPIIITMFLIDMIQTFIGTAG